MASGNQQVGHLPCKCEVGKKFFFVSRGSSISSRNCEVTVIKVGRKWARLSNGYRFDLRSKDWRDVDGGNLISPGRLWDSGALYRETLEVKKIIEEIKEQFPCFSKRFERVSLENARQAAKLLGLTIHCADPSPERT